MNVYECNGGDTFINASFDEANMLHSIFQKMNIE